MKRITIVAISMFLLVACSQEVKQALEQAKAEKNPSKSLEIIRQAQISYLESCQSLRCTTPDELDAAETNYFVKAAKAGDERALHELFADRVDLNELRSELKGVVLTRSKDSKNGDLLIAAANIYGNDTLGIVNKEQQIQYLKRAWAVGDTKSAGKLAHIYVRMKNFDGAYLWSLRCIQDCKRSDDVRTGEYTNQIELVELEKHLDANQIAKLQTDSATSSIY